jgi:uncharacterized membrane protein YccC
MLSEEQLIAYRAMTPGQRLKLTLEMIEWSFPQLLSGPAEVVDRRFELLNRQNDERNQALLKGLAQAAKRHESG